MLNANDRRCRQQTPIESLQTARSAPPGEGQGRNMTGESEILNLLRTLDSKIDDIGIRLDRIDREHGRALEENGRALGEHGRMLEVHGRILEVHGRMLEENSRALELLRQDVGSIRVAQAAQGNTLHILLQDTRMLRAALNDVAKENVTPGEVEALHEDLSRLQQQVSHLNARLAVVESRDHAESGTEIRPR
jgi:hypothetical protein